MFKRHVLSWMGLLIVLIWAVQLTLIFFQQDNIWWTPKAMALNLESAKAQVEVLVGERDLKQALDQQEIFLRQADGAIKPLGLNDVKFRLNNWDAQRADSYQYGMMYVAFIMLGLLMVVFDIRRGQSSKRRVP